ncbi:MAG: 3-deoxy-D-manno-octulosonic acid kinase [Gammaproteobacteria bacterium]|nr:3-deoxy-D-manno-octulosonic acid kinase [Gammaproteobacteria bacterium]MCP4929675.1 3-deoxy-D-manno-octulosonic acid kinase [Gammaproteobacteria bacterium]
MVRQVNKSGDSVIVYDDRKLSQISPADFSIDRLADAERAQGQAGRHGAVCFVKRGDQDWAVRHYYRGGLIGKVFNDQYFWTGENNTRSFREWDLLQQMVASGLPVPVPVAGRYMRSGFYYRADLITQRIPGAVPFSSRLEKAAGNNELWVAVGKCIARFHAAGFCHADLNAHNIQVDALNQIWILDWDRGAHRQQGNWKAVNLARLQRSCRKICRNAGAGFMTDDWGALLAGYKDKNTF